MVFRARRWIFEPVNFIAPGAGGLALLRQGLLIMAASACSEGARNGGLGDVGVPAGEGLAGQAFVPIPFLAAFSRSLKSALSAGAARGIRTPTPSLRSAESGRPWGARRFAPVRGNTSHCGGRRALRPLGLMYSAERA